MLSRVIKAQVLSNRYHFFISGLVGSKSSIKLLLELP
uniref:Uncharacterized protein n=1 Tax=Arundo donax TaxID=35708 RepID=A0A0A9GXV7_ARUDO